MTTGARIRYMRKKAGLTQKDLADKLEISPANIVQWENGIRKPKLETLKRIAAALNVDYTELIDPNSDPSNFTPEEYLQRAVDALSHQILSYEDTSKILHKPITPERRNQYLSKSLAIVSSNFNIDQNELLNEWRKSQLSPLTLSDPLIQETVDILNTMNLDGQMALLRHARELAQIPSYQKEH